MKFRVTFEIDEEVEADDREEAVEKAIGNITGGGYFENELTEHMDKKGYVAGCWYWMDVFANNAKYLGKTCRPKNCKRKLPGNFCHRP